MSNNKRPKQDLRVEKTQRALVTALLTLLEKRPLNKITVNDICELALVSRATFYIHFEDKYHLLRCSLSHLGRTMAEGADGQDRDSVLSEILDYITRRPKLFQHLFLEEGNAELNQMLSTLFAEGVMEELDCGDCGLTDDQARLMAVFYAGGLTSLIGWWIHSGFKMPREELAENLRQLFSSQIPQ